MNENNVSNNDLNKQLSDVSLNQTMADHMMDTTSEDDSIGDTVFSKHWLFKCLLNTVKLINGEKNDSDVTQAPSAPVELDEQSEEELCILWDMSTNEDVMSFLNDIKAIDLFETIIFRTNSPRFAEISAGIVANIAINSDICRNLANRQTFRQLVLDSMSSSDIPFVIQLQRLMSTSLTNTEVQGLWLTSIRENYLQFFKTIQYLFENCLNCDLLKSSIRLVNKMLYLDNSIGQLWLSSDQTIECVKCLVSACNQLLAEDSENIESLDNLWLIIHSLMISNNDFIETHLLCNRNELLLLFNRYICDSFGESVDYIIASAQRAGSLSASIAVINQILYLSTQQTIELLFNPQLIDCLHELHINCEQYLKQLSSESDQKISFQLAFDQLIAIQHIFNDFNRKRLNSVDISQTR